MSFDSPKSDGSILLLPPYHILENIDTIAKKLKSATEQKDIKSLVLLKRKPLPIAIYTSEKFAQQKYPIELE